MRSPPSLLYSRSRTRPGPSVRWWTRGARPEPCSTMWTHPRSTTPSSLLRHSHCDQHHYHEPERFCQICFSSGTRRMAMLRARLGWHRGASVPASHLSQVVSSRSSPQQAAELCLTARSGRPNRTIMKRIRALQASAGKAIGGRWIWMSSGRRSCRY